MTPTFPRIILEITTKSLYRKVYIIRWRLEHESPPCRPLYQLTQCCHKTSGICSYTMWRFNASFFPFFLFRSSFPVGLNILTHSLLQGALRYRLCVRHLPWFIYGPGLDTGRTLHPGRYEHQDKMLSFP